MARFSDSFLDELRDRLLVSEVVSRRVQLKKEGAEWKGLSPFNKERTPSFTVNDEKKFWHDFSSSRHGDIFGFEMQVSGVSFVEAVETLASLANMALPADRRSNGPQQPAAAPPTDQLPPLDTKRRVTAEYNYTDADGGLLYQNCRLEWLDKGRKVKTFNQRRRATSEFGGGWIWGLKAGKYVQGRDGDWYQLTAGREEWTGPRTAFEDQLPTLYRFAELREEMAQPVDERRIVFCYRGDAEVLTPRGWVELRGLSALDAVAQWDITTEKISFAVPIARQHFSYRGKMVNIRSTWCDLVVTADHRQPARHGRCKSKVFSASEIYKSQLLPIAGMFDGEGGPTINQARLIAAWIADGVREPRGRKVSWSLKKDRKKQRLRHLLSACGVAWTEHNPKSTPGWTGFRVRKVDLDFIWRSVPNKTWPWSALSWSVSVRQAILDEIQYWDGDAATKNTQRLFTSDHQSADVICAIASCTGWGAAVRVDRRRGSLNYIVNLSRKNWRTISKDPIVSDFDGDVYCCTVPTGFIVIRQNGKVLISGNCPEGEKDCDTLAAWGLVATDTSGGTANWKPHHAEELRDADVVILMDNDEPGRKYAHVKAASLRGIAASVRVLDWRDFWPSAPEKADITDWRDLGGGSKEKLFEIVDKLTMWTPAPPESAFGALRWADLDLPAREFEWLVKGVIQRMGVSLWYGPPNCGKSFLVMDAAFCVAQGLPFFGRRTRQGLVVYQAGEGGLDLRNRMRAYRQHNGIPAAQNVPFVLLTLPVDLYVSEENVDKLIAEIKAWAAYYSTPLELVVVDTLSAATPGADENASKDMTKVLARAHRISRECSAHVAIVHHTNADGKRPRGHSSLTGNVDTAVEVLETGQIDFETVGERKISRIIRQFTVRKQKAGPTGDDHRFVIPAVKVGTDAEGDAVTSCVVRPLDIASTMPTRGEIPKGWMILQPNALMIMRALDNVLKKYGRVPLIGVHAPDDAVVVTIAEWRQELYDRQWAGEDPSDPGGKRLMAKCKQAIQRTYSEKTWADSDGINIIGKSGEWVWRTSRKVAGLDPLPRPDRTAVAPSADDEPQLPADIEDFDPQPTRAAAPPVDPLPAEFEER